MKLVRQKVKLAMPYAGAFLKKDDRYIFFFFFKCSVRQTSVSDSLLPGDNSCVSLLL